MFNCTFLSEMLFHHLLTFIISPSFYFTFLTFPFLMFLCILVFSFYSPFLSNLIVFINYLFPKCYIISSYLSLSLSYLSSTCYLSTFCFFNFKDYIFNLCKLFVNVCLFDFQIFNLFLRCQCLHL